jgi:AbrB family looped-hinge helix DNA binding protein
VRLTEKGQVTIPIDIRHQLGLEPGDEIEFVVDADRLRLHKSAVSPRRGSRIVDHLLDHGGDVDMSTDEIMALTRGE